MVLLIQERREGRLWKGLNQKGVPGKARVS
jgi:hypothetical protein